ncbi:hypothetical protein KVK54_02390 [Helicobacter pylori]|nr:hypothetical protein KVK54_02390 [Helicobacter pylori]
MISIDLFKTDGRFARGMHNTKIIYSAIRYGAKGIAKVSPVLVCMDVVLSKEHLDEYEKKFPYDNAQRIVALRQQYHEALTAHCQVSLNFIGD